MNPTGKGLFERALEWIGATLKAIFERSDADGISTGRAAEELAASRLAAA